MSLDSYLSEKITAPRIEVIIVCIGCVIFGYILSLVLANPKPLPQPPAGVDKPAPQVIIIRPDQGPHNPFKDEGQNNR